GQFILEKLNIKQLTSTRDLGFTSSNNQKATQAILFGDPAFNFNLSDSLTNSEDEIRNPGLTASTIRKNDTGEFATSIAPLPGTMLEVNKISEILRAKKWDAQTFLGERALEKNLKNVNSPALLHIATHGYFNNSDEGGEITAEDNPLLNAGLLFAGSEENLLNQQNQVLRDPKEEDGILTAFEAMNLRLDNTELVVLSACETGSGTIKNGEGVYGLQRSSQVAGTDNIIFSLWKVDDEATERLMTNFYEHWMA